LRTSAGRGCGTWLESSPAPRSSLCSRCLRKSAARSCAWWTGSKNGIASRHIRHKKHIRHIKEEAVSLCAFCAFLWLLFVEFAAGVEVVPVHDRVEDQEIAALRLPAPEGIG